MSEGNKTYDAAIVGAGPAGVSCAIWLARLGLAPILIEAAEEAGGLCRSHPFRDDWNASLPGQTGPQVADNLACSLEQAGVPALFSRSVAAVRQLNGQFKVLMRGASESVLAHRLVLATGVRARTLPSSQNMQDAGQWPGVLTGPGAHVVAQDFQGKRVAVLGGGDNAFENALYVRERGARSVEVFARSIRAQQQFIRRFPAEAIYVGRHDIDAASLTVNGSRYDLLLVFYGWEPCIAFAESLSLRRTSRGFVATDAATAQASCPGVYAIGEVAQRMHPCVVTALADGVTAAKAIQAEAEQATASA